MLTTVSDRKIGVYSNGSLTLPNDTVVAVVDYYEPHMVNATDYYAFGMPSRVAGSATGKDYRYGFNGKENDNEVKGFGNQQDYGMRIYDARVGRFLSVDPLTADYPWYTPYQFAGNKPIFALDLDGAEEMSYMERFEYDGGWGWFDWTKAIPNAAGKLWNGAVVDSWNSAVATVKSVRKGTYLSDLKNDVKTTVSGVKNYAKETINYVANTPVKQQLGDAWNYFSSPQALEDGLVIAGGIYSGGRIGSGKTNSFLRLNSVNEIKTVLTKPLQTIRNKLPVSVDGKFMGEILNGEAKMLGTVKAEGTFDFIVTVDGKVHLGRKHSFMSGGADVQAAGEIKLRGGKVVGVNNASGHYTPNLQETNNFLKILQNQGVDISDAHLTIYGENGKILENITPSSKKRSNYTNQSN